VTCEESDLCLCVGERLGRRSSEGPRVRTGLAQGPSGSESACVGVNASTVWRWEVSENVRTGQRQADCGRGTAGQVIQRMSVDNAVWQLCQRGAVWRGHTWPSSADARFAAAEERCMLTSHVTPSPSQPSPSPSRDDPLESCSLHRTSRVSVSQSTFIRR